MGIDSLNLNINNYIEASAGTGKTFSIIQLVKRLINSGKSLDEILIVTYTEKAAGELKYRIRKALIEVSNNLDFDNVPIFTIHSFCKSVLSEFNVSSNCSSSLSLIDDSVLENFIHEYITNQGKYDVASYLRLLDDFNINNLISRIESVMKSYYLNKEFEEDKSVISYSTNDFTSVDLFKMILEKNFDSLQESSLKDALCVLKSGSDKAKDLYDSLESRVSEYGDFNFNGKIFQARYFKDINEKNAFSEVYKIKEDLKSIDVCCMNDFITKHLKDIYESFAKYKEENNFITFNDMIRYVREDVINNGKLKECISKKYSFAIIDEFQDTNKLQWDIFKNIFMSPNHNILVVGDRKQSIYSFQGADVNVYLQAIEDIKQSGGGFAVLDENYRSSEEIIKACNELFETEALNQDDLFINDFTESKCPELNKSKVYATFDGKKIDDSIIVVHKKNDVISDIEYAKIVAEKIVEYTSKDKDGKSRLYFYFQEKDKKGNFIPKERSCSFKDFAILCRTRSELYAIKNELTKVGIPFLLYKDDSLFSGLECAHWIALFEALNSPDFSGYNRNTLKKALFTKFFNKTLEELHSDIYDRDDFKELELFNKWKGLVSISEWESLIDSIIMDSEIEKTLNNYSGKQSLTKFCQIADFCLNYLYQNHNLNDLIRKLVSLNKDIDFDDDDSSDIVRKGSDFDCVQLMTIHASKGLEFSVVFSAQGFKGPLNSIKVCSYHDKEDDNNLKIQLGSCDDYKKENALECRRLSYVNFTRPKFLLIMPFAKEIKGDFGYLNKVTKNYLDKHQEVSIDYSNYTFDSNHCIDIKKKVKMILSNENIVQSDLSISIESNKEVINKEKNTFTYKHSYSSLSHSHEDETDKEGKVSESILSVFDSNSKQIDGLYDNSINPVSISKDYPKGNKIGSALHAVFEYLDFLSIDDEFKESQIKNLISDKLNDELYHVKDEWINDSFNLIKEVLHSKLPEIKGNSKTNTYFSLNEISFENKKSEANFDFIVNSNTLKNYLDGSIDLVFKRGDVYSIIDWKSDSLNDDDLLSYNRKEDLKQRVDNRYSIQRVLYSYSLIKWLQSFYQDKTLEDIFNEHFGGIYYIFVKGCNTDTSNGIYCQTWNSFKDLEDAYHFITKRKMGE